ncbi:MAG: hypothetical protein KME57_27010 [Scytonema hyalinum WJT4-NPBG1]|uniref:hypothetical protein n=1 Tax=Scytonema sp. PRP1 TaxID=3120513 RepID=UPI00300D5008|nr:hypothetical protein [Scytonema hyalinum WJT4-NPBG1]
MPCVKNGVSLVAPLSCLEWIYDVHQNLEVLSYHELTVPITRHQQLLQLID